MAVSLYNQVSLGANADADSSTDWTGGVQVIELNIEGTACIGEKISNTNAAIYFTNPTTLNFGGGGGAEGRGMYVWFNCTTPGFLAATNGITGFAGNDISNYEAFDVSSVAAGTYQGGWKNVAIYPGVADNAGDVSAGTYSNTTIDTFGVFFNVASTIMGNIDNAFVDAIIVAEGLQTNATETTFNAFFSTDDTNKWGVMLKDQGIYFPQGKLVFVSGSNFTSNTSEVVVFADQPVGSIAGYYELLLQNGSTTTFGSFANNVSSGGVTLSTGNTAQYYDLTVESGATANFYGCNFTNARNVTLQSGNAVRGTTFANTNGIIDANGATINDCLITGGDRTEGTLQISSNTEMQAVTNTVFSNNVRAIEITAAGSYDLSGLTFSGNTYEIYFSPTSGNLTLNLANGTTALSATKDVDVLFNAANTAGTLTVNNNVSLAVEGLLGNSEVRIYNNPSRLTGNSTSTQAGGVETVAAVTQVGNGTNGVTYGTDGVRIVVAIAGQTTAATELVAGNKFRVLVRDNADNPTLQLFDEFEVFSISSNQIVTTTSDTGFTSVFGTVLNSGNFKTVTIEKVNATETFSLPAGTYDIAIFRTASQPIYFLGRSISADGSIPVTQIVDRVYNNPV